MTVFAGHAMSRSETATLLIAQFVLAIAPATLSGAQQESAPTFRTNVREVLVPVVVTDQKGHYVADLKGSDFKVIEDGALQDIRAVSSSSDPGFANALKAAPVFRDGRQPVSTDAEPGETGRTYLICVDTLHSAFENFARVRETISKVLASEEGHGSRYALVTLGKEFKVQQQPANDASQIAATARSRDFANAIQQSEAANISAFVRRFRDLMQGYCANCACSATGQSVDAPTCSLYKGQVQGALASFGERTSALTANFLAQLQQLVKAAASLPGARTVVLISDGFNRFPGRELYAILQAYGPSNSTLPHLEPRDMAPEMESILRFATEYNVVIYTLDSRGVYVAASAGAGQDASTPFSSPALNDSASASPQSSAAASMASGRELMTVGRENTDGMALLARATGGLFFEHSNDLAKGLRTALEDGRRYYVLAYISKNQSLDGRYRKIEVQVNGRKKLRVIAKAGYWTEKE